MIIITRLTKREIPKLDSLQEATSEILDFTFTWNWQEYRISITQGKSTSTTSKGVGRVYYIWELLWVKKETVWSKKWLYERLSQEMSSLWFKSKDDSLIDEVVVDEHQFDIGLSTEIIIEQDTEDEEDIEDEEDTKLSDEIQDIMYEWQINELTSLLRKDKKAFDKLNNLSPRKYQNEGIDKTIECLIDRRKKYKVWKGLLVLPTWFGKTFIAAQIADKLKKLEKSEKPFRVLFLVHKNDIVAQTSKIMENWVKGPFTNFFWYDKVWMLIWWKKPYHKAVNNIFSKTPNDVIVANINTLVWLLHTFEKDYFDIIIADECHRSVWATYRKCIDYFNYKYLLGVTATPSRVWKKSGLTTDSLFNFYENNVIYQRELEDAITEKILATPHYFVRVKETDLTELESDIKKQILYKTNYNGHTKSKKKYLDNFDVFDKDVDYLYQNNKKTVVFCESIDIAEEVYHKINNKWYPTIRMFFRPDRFNKDWKQICKRTWESKITPDRFMTLIDQFKQMKSWFLVVVDLFIEWTDIPEINWMMLLRSTSSERIYFQILWRWLRKTETKDSCLVFDYNFETIRLDLLKKKINLFNLIRKDINTEQYKAQYILSSDYINKLNSVITDFEGDEDQQDRFKATHKSTMFRDVVIPEVVKDMFSIISNEQESNREKITKFKEYKYSIVTVWKKNLFEERLSAESLIYYTKLLDLVTLDDIEEYLLDSEVTVANKIIARVSTSTRDTDWLTFEQKKKLDEFLDKNSHIGTNYSFEHKTIGDRKMLYVKYENKGQTSYSPLDDFKKVWASK